eukprot:COSAG05_NODE_1784_length_4092_cov_122.148175_1_plen_328_part_00
MLQLLAAAVVGSSRTAQVVVYHHAAPQPLGKPANDGSQPSKPTTLESALLAAAASPTQRHLVQLAAGTYPVARSFTVPSGTALIGDVDQPAVLDGGVKITGWSAARVGDDGTPWLFSATLPEALRRPAKVHQLWVGGQRRGVARSATMTMARTARTLNGGYRMYQGNVTAAGIIAQPGQLLPQYNSSTLRCVTFQHWTACPRMVINNPFYHIPRSGPPLNATNELIFGCGRTLNKAKGIGAPCAPQPFTGDDSTGQRYYLEDAPEFLAPGRSVSPLCPCSILDASGICMGHLSVIYSPGGAVGHSSRTACGFSTRRWSRKLPSPPVS